MIIELGNKLKFKIHYLAIKSFTYNIINHDFLRTSSLIKKAKDLK